ncbi:DUF4381 domain-containing protein [Blastopirellula sp. J2-11]|uniref:DUF4381 domain-containing protein n=1 Tax=Blastopirellula sp. J2-11 TaxID=2943192 RepID=UPI0021C7A08D|nr:DUF4381 domain-containing protein [Blastopirellula sp. J2-11]UUO07190.1 DUF4381 domain-containing protein [Blastopirellula sp. J2-11]
MKDDATSLDKLHDIVVPPEVSWWPLAPGWWVLLALLLTGIVYLLYRSWKDWRANAYRRIALKELLTANSVSAISELLRRTALKVAPRSEIASQTANAWPDWLAKWVAKPISDSCRQQLADGGYSAAHDASDLGELRGYAANWIKFHRIPENPENTSEQT